MGGLVHLEGHDEALMMMMVVMKVTRGQAPPCLPALHSLLLFLLHYLSPLINY